MFKLKNMLLTISTASPRHALQNVKLRNYISNLAELPLMLSLAPRGGALSPPYLDLTSLIYEEGFKRAGDTEGCIVLTAPHSPPPTQQADPLNRRQIFKTIF